MKGWRSEGVKGWRGRVKGVKDEEVEENERAQLTLCSVKTINSTFL